MARAGVNGVIAVADGQEEEIHAANVIIATGGYAGNTEMLQRYYPFYSDKLYAIGLPHDGDGIRMALDIGAADEGLGNLHLRGPYFHGAMECVVAGMQPTALWVNAKGERFVDEGKAFYWPEAANALNLQPGQTSFTLFDEVLKTCFIEEGIVYGYNRFRQDAKLAHLDKALERAVAEGKAIRAHKIEEVSAFIGAPHAVLVATLGEYNAACRRRRDALFLKDAQFLKPIDQPPYYALACHQSFFATIGGIRIDHRMHVLDKGGAPIPGLFAAGNDTGGWETDTYCLSLPGMALGFAIISGRISGENAAAELSTPPSNSQKDVA